MGIETGENEIETARFAGGMLDGIKGVQEQIEVEDGTALGTLNVDGNRAA